MISEEVVDSGSVAQLKLGGDLDMAGVLKVEPTADQLVSREGLLRFIVDLRNLEFIDSTGLGMLLTLAQRTRTEGIEMLVVRGPQNVQRVFEVSGVPLTFVDAVPDDAPAGRDVTATGDASS